MRTNIEPKDETNIFHIETFTDENFKYKNLPKEVRNGHYQKSQPPEHGFWVNALRVAAFLAAVLAVCYLGYFIHQNFDFTILFMQLSLFPISLFLLALSWRMLIDIEKRQMSVSEIQKIVEYLPNNRIALWGGCTEDQFDQIKTIIRNWRPINTQAKQ